MKTMQALYGMFGVVGLLFGAAAFTAASAADFQTRCAASGVVKCVNFDTDTDFSVGRGGQQGAWGSRFGLLPRYGTTDYSRATRDTAQAASGASSLRFTIPSNSSADSSGAWFTNFSDDLSFQVSEGQEVFVQWRQRFSPEFLNTVYLASDGSRAGGWKMADISAGDLNTCTPGTAESAKCPTTCWDFETVIQNTNQRSIPQVYTNCAGPFPYRGLTGYTSNVTVQNAVGCLYPDYATPPCIKYRANEWMTFQVRIKVGHWDQWDSTIQMWVGYQGQPSVLVIDCSSTATNPCNNGINNEARNGWYLHNSDHTYKIGKLWLLPYHTNKDPNQAHPTAYTWYDDVIISRTKIAEPDGGPVVRPNPPANVTAQ
jgi:hypothetical protein